MCNPEITLHLVRHGQSEWNAQGRLQGQIGYVPLTDLGRRQARQAAEALAGCGATMVVSSDSLRAVQTAEPIAAKLGAALRTTPALREQRLGALEGHLSKDVWASYDCDDRSIADWRPPGGESTREVYRRLAGFLSQLVGRLPAPSVVLVTHGDTLRIARGYLEGASPDAIPWSVAANGSITSVTIASTWLGGRA